MSTIYCVLVVDGLNKVVEEQSSICHVFLEERDRIGAFTVDD